jgi:hypothetical protein
MDNRCWLIRSLDSSGDSCDETVELVRCLCDILSPTLIKAMSRVYTEAMQRAEHALGSTRKHPKFDDLLDICLIKVKYIPMNRFSVILAKIDESTGRRGCFMRLVRHLVKLRMSPIATLRQDSRIQVSEFLYGCYRRCAQTLYYMDGDERKDCNKALTKTLLRSIVMGVLTDITKCMRCRTLSYCHCSTWRFR